MWNPREDKEYYYVSIGAKLYCPLYDECGDLYPCVFRLAGTEYVADVRNPRCPFDVERVSENLKPIGHGDEE